MHTSKIIYILCLTLFVWIWHSNSIQEYFQKTNNKEKITIEYEKIFEKIDQIKDQPCVSIQNTNDHINIYLDSIKCSNFSDKKNLNEIYKSLQNSDFKWVRKIIENQKLYNKLFFIKLWKNYILSSISFDDSILFFTKNELGTNPWDYNIIRLSNSWISLKQDFFSFDIIKIYFHILNSKYTETIYEKHKYVRSKYYDKFEIIIKKYLNKLNKKDLDNIFGIEKTSNDLQNIWSAKYFFTNSPVDIELLKTKVSFWEKLSSNILSPAIEYWTNENVDIKAICTWSIISISKNTNFDDSEIWIKCDLNKDYIVIYDHVTDINIKKWSQIKAWSIIWKIWEWNRTELQINSAYKNLSYCPLNFWTQYFQETHKIFDSKWCLQETVVP